MTFTTNPTTEIGKIRVIISDSDSQYPFFQDEELQVFLGLAGDVRRAAADALDTMASNQAMVMKVIATLDLETDGAATARALREHAKTLREQAKEADAGDGALFDIAEFADDAFTRRKRIQNQSLRNR
jgi:hypothetical protein